jgi:hypothetical protein
MTVTDGHCCIVGDSSPTVSQITGTGEEQSEAESPVIQGQFARECSIPLITSQGDGTHRKMIYFELTEDGAPHLLEDPATHKSVTQEQ